MLSLAAFSKANLWVVPWDLVPTAGNTGFPMGSSTYLVALQQKTRIMCHHWTDSSQNFGCRHFKMFNCLKELLTTNCEICCMLQSRKPITYGVVIFWQQRVNSNFGAIISAWMKMDNCWSAGKNGRLLFHKAGKQDKQWWSWISLKSQNIFITAFHILQWKCIQQTFAWL